MNISVKGEYALQAMFDLAERAGGEPVKIGAIARRWKIPQKFLELILAGLKQGGFVESRRGAEGGYLLARAPESITVGEVLRYVEGPKLQRAAPGKADDPLSVMWGEVDRAISTVIDQTSFSDLIRSWRERQSRYVPSFDI